MNELNVRHQLRMRCCAITYRVHTSYVFARNMHPICFFCLFVNSVMMPRYRGADLDSDEGGHSYKELDPSTACVPVYLHIKLLRAAISPNPQESTVQTLHPNTRLGNTNENQCPLNMNVQTDPRCTRTTRQTLTPHIIPFKIAPTRQQFMANALHDVRD